jgi:hypothetical protein
MAKEKAADLLSRIGSSFESPSPIRLDLDVDDLEATEEPSSAQPASPAREPIPSPVGPSRKPEGAARRKGVSVGKTDPNVPKETTRFSLDLDKLKHKEFKMFAIENETDASVVGRILVDILLESDSLKTHVTKRLQEMKGE